MRLTVVVAYLFQMSLLVWAAFLAESAYVVMAYVAGIVYGVTVAVCLWPHQREEHGA